MLDETIDILDLLYQRKPFDYDGKHYHLKLSQLDPMYYPPKPVQQPRIPLWVPGIWPRMKSMQRILKCDGLFPQKMNPKGEFEEVTPDDLHQMIAYIGANRTLTTPFDIVAEGKTNGLDQARVKEKLQEWAEAGAAWWVEGLWEATEEQATNRLRPGPPKMYRRPSGASIQRHTCSPTSPHGYGFKVETPRRGVSTAGHLHSHVTASSPFTC